MTGRASSPVFVGRGDERTTLRTALERAAGGDGSAVVVGGEAGIGKTRLVEEFAQSARAAGARVVIGGCLELGTDGLAFTPFTAALRALLRQLGRDRLVAMLGDRTELARLLPELGPAPADAADDTARARLFEELLSLFGRLGEEQPLVLALEDLHWADASSRELFAFCVRNVSASRVLVVATYRSDELYRRHPLRPLLAELDRAGGIARVELARLSRQEVAEQASAVLGGEADPALVNTIYERSDGNPLFVETLLSCPQRATSGIDESLRDLLLRTVEQLPDDTQQLLRLAAIGGVRVGYRLLAAVAGLGQAQLDSAVRPAVEANVLFAEEEGYRFRHALIREAVHDELLPGEHARLHARYAETIEAEPTLVSKGRFAVETAHHWHAAHQSERALAAAWRAAESAPKAHAYAEQLSMLGRVLELWDAAPDAAARVGVDYLTVLERAVAAALRSGDFDRGLTYAGAALDEIDDGHDPLRAAKIQLQRSKLLRDLGRPGGRDALREAARLTEADPDSQVRAQVLERLARKCKGDTVDTEVTATATEALEIARRSGDRRTEAEALAALAWSQFDSGEVSTALATYGEARALAREIGAADLITRAAINESDGWEGLGNYERAIEVAREGHREAKAAGIARTTGAFLALNVVGPLVELGRWDEATELAERTVQLDPPPGYRAFFALWRADVALSRGDVRDADRYLGQVRSFAGDNLEEVQLWLPLTRLEAELAAVRGDRGGALAGVRKALGEPLIVRFPRYAWPLLATGAAMLGYAARAGDPDRALAAELRRVAERLPVLGTAQPAFRAVYVAELARAEGGADVAAWHAAVAACERARAPYPLAYAAFRAGEAAIEADDRPAAAQLLRRAAAITADLGARPLADAVADLARRARLPLTDGQPAAPPARERQLGLTTRELDVLRLVAAGRSNGQIAGELYISPKTASVHVSNIIAKLGVDSRGEAAAIAHEQALFG